MQKTGRTARSLYLLLAGSIAVPLMLFGAFAWSSWQDALQEAEITADRDARLIAEHLRAIMMVHELALNRVRSRLRAGEGASFDDPESLHRLLKSVTNDSPGLTAMFLIGEDGRQLATSLHFPAAPVQYADRDYFHVMRGTGQDWYLGASVVSRQLSRRVLPYVRRLEDENGRFQGLVVTAIEVDGVISFVDALRDGGIESVTAARSDGTVLLRIPEITTGVETLSPSSGFMRTIKASTAGGAYRVVSQLDRVDRIHVVRKVDGRDIYVSYGIDMTSIRAAWLRGLLPLGTLAAAATLALTGAAAFALRRARGEAAAVARWRDEAAQRSLAENTLKQAQKLEAVGQLTGGVAHDVNNHLQVIAANLQLLDHRHRGDGDERRLVHNALSGVHRAARLISQLLAFARRQPLEPRTVETGHMLRELTELVGRTLGEAIQVELVTGPGVWNIHADPDQLQSALLNLAVNSRDAMQGRGRLTIEAGNLIIDEAYAAAHVDVTPGPYVMIAVSDDGPGIPPEIVDRVFEPFFTTKPYGEGTGLGLSMVFGFVKQSGGHVKIYSETGRGTTVELYLPKASAESAAHVPENREFAGGTETVLVVEDNERVREATAALVLSLGYRVLTAAGPDEALRILADGAQPDLLFTDVIMPGTIPTPEFVRRAQELKSGLRIVYASGYTANSIVHDGRLDEGIVFLPKPFSREALARKLRQALDAGGRREDCAQPAVAERTERKVLLVEDDAIIRMSTAEMIEELGYGVVEAEDAEAALRLFETDAIDIVVTDLHLPRVSGVSLVEEIRRRRPSTGVIVASGDTAALPEGIPVLAKPYDLASLRSALARAEAAAA